MEIFVSIVILIATLLIGVPVPFCFGLSVVWLTFSLNINPAFFFGMSYQNLSSVVLFAIPLFIMAGGIIERGRIGEVLVNWVMLFLGKVRGSLGVVGVVASAVFSSICGSGAATISCIGSILAPQMKKKGYPMGKCAAIVCCAGPLGLVLPPSATQILVAWVGGLSVLACFLAIVFPGLLLVGFLSVGAFMLLKSHNIIEKDAVPRGQFLRELGRRTFTAIPALIMPVIILGGFYGGFITPTEAAGI
jgi:tripartite ATP-independent transporter DctM subunit